jgi:hypothetical protein
MLTPLEEVIKKYRRIRYWCGDESRMGLITLWARKLTGEGSTASRDRTMVL